MSKGSLAREKESPMAQIVDRNILALLERRRKEVERQGLQERLAGAVTAFADSMRFIYLHVLLVLAWVLINAGFVPWIPKYDPTFVILATVASVEAIFLSTFVLMTQNRMASLADKRADLDLQVSLLAEHEITQLIKLVKAVAAKLDIREAQDPELDELARDVAPEKVLDRMETHSGSSDADGCP